MFDYQCIIQNPQNDLIFVNYCKFFYTFKSQFLALKSTFQIVDILITATPVLA